MVKPRRRHRRARVWGDRSYCRLLIWENMRF